LEESKERQRSSRSTTEEREWGGLCGNEEEERYNRRRKNISVGAKKIVRFATPIVTTSRIKTAQKTGKNATWTNTTGCWVGSMQSIET
jgi:hypothetical protein